MMSNSVVGLGPYMNEDMRESESEYLGFSDIIDAQNAMNTPPEYSVLSG